MERMKACFLTITTTVDGQEMHFTKDGEFEILSLENACVRYYDDGAVVSITMNGQEISLARNGDYTLRLTLKNGEANKGVIGIGGSEGEILVKTDKVAYSLTENSIMMSLRYDLYIGTEIQKMKLRLHAKAKNKGENV